MAEQVNQRIENMINELEQMRRTNLFDDEEIREISRKRKEFEYRIQRRVKQKEDFVQYIAYEIALLEDISLRRKQAKLGEKKKDIEFAIAKRLNKIFKQFIYRFQNEVEIYFEYIKFCKSVGFDQAISGIIGQMLQIHGDKPKMWQLACKWEKQEQNNLETARNFLLKGIHRHPESDILYLELFQIELTLCFRAKSEEQDVKTQLKRADVIWRNGIKHVQDIHFLFKLYDICLKFEADDSIKNAIKEEIWSNRDNKDVWSYIASKELEGVHWEEIEDYCDEESNYSEELKHFIGTYKEALTQFSDESLCTKFLHGLLGASESVCSDSQKIWAVKDAWLFGLENDVLNSEMFEFGFEVLKLENTKSEKELLEILKSTSLKLKQSVYVWEQILALCKGDEKLLLQTLQEATKMLKPDDSVQLWNLMLENVDSKELLKKLYTKFQNCESSVMLSLKPKLLKKMYELNGLKAARDMYEELIKAPPTQVEVHKTMIEIEKSQEKPNTKNIRKYYECLVQQHGSDNVEAWMDYMKFETELGNTQAANIYRRAVAALKKELVEVFINAQTMAKLK
ncbi:U3 small nucleolar RNA-associated protein 6 homolog [Ostrinia nubilalis]|uniref:U3 small nucleolar RNA-associated protein 6 homolog n=1 Tax=Ostrinia nubilalis TaxID=29057 RepID=UPI00308233FC